MLRIMLGVAFIVLGVVCFVVSALVRRRWLANEPYEERNYD